MELWGGALENLITDFRGMMEKISAMSSASRGWMAPELQRTAAGLSHLLSSPRGSCPPAPELPQVCAEEEVPVCV